MTDGGFRKIGGANGKSWGESWGSNFSSLICISIEWRNIIECKDISMKEVFSNFGNFLLQAHGAHTHTHLIFLFTITQYNFHFQLCKKKLVHHHHHHYNCKYSLKLCCSIVYPNANSLSYCLFPQFSYFFFSWNTRLNVLWKLKLENLAICNEKLKWKIFYKLKKLFREGG